MNIREKIRDQIKIIDEGYLLDPNKIVQDYMQEIRSITSYNGRQLYELLQNAEDAIEEGITDGIISNEENCGVLISFHNGVLTVANSGKPFDFDGVVSLMYSGLSPKVNKRMIGKKGLGFRSILSWAKNVRLFSGDLALEFSRDYAISHYKDLCSKKPAIKQVVGHKKEKFVDYPIATLSSPKIIERDNTLTEYSTYVVIEVKDSQELIRQINEQIDSLNVKDILFLKEISYLKIERDGCSDIVIKKEVVDGKVKIHTANGDTQDVKAYILKTQKGEISVTKESGTENEPYEIDLAYNSDGNFTGEEFLYNYFKTNVKLPFGFIVNCPFELTENRNDLPLINSTNDLLMKELALLIVFFAEELARTFKEPYQSLLSCGVKGFSNMSKQFAVLVSEIQSLLVNAKVLPLVTGDFASSKDGIYFSGQDYTKCLNKNILEKFLVNSEDFSVNNYVKNALGVRPMQLSDFSQIVESQIDIMSKTEKAQCAYFIIKDYATEIYKSDKLPHLLVDVNEKAITSGKVYALDKKYAELKMPKFSKFSILDPEQFEIFKQIFNCNSAEDLAVKLSCFNLIKYEFDKIATELISQINENLNYIIEFIHWIEYVNKKFPGFIILSSLRNNLNLVNSEGELKKASELFFGKEYGFDTTYEIISKVAPDKLLATPEFYEIEKDAIDDYIRIFELLEVSRFPRKKIVDFSYSTQIDYIDYSFGKNSIVEIYGKQYEISRYGINHLTGKGKPYNIKIKVTIIEYLEKILQEVPFETIMKWIMEDRNLRALLSEKSELDTSEISFFHNGAKTVPSTVMKPYVKYVFSKYPWIKAETGIKYISECCLSIKGMSPIVEQPVFQPEKYGTKNIKETERNFNNILIDLGVAENFSNLPVDIVYQILLELPQRDPEGKLTRNIYDQFVQSKFELEDVKECVKYKEFLSQGKVFAVKNDSKAYCDIGEVYYSDNRIFSENLINRFNMLNLSKRRGEKKVNDLLGIKPLKDINIRVTHNKPSKYNDAFGKYVREFFPYVLAFVKNTASTSVIDKLTVQLVTEINAEYKGDEEYIEYEVRENESVLVNDGGKYAAFILINDERYSSFEKVYGDYLIADVIAEIITGVLKVEENRTTYRELFSKSENQRRTLLKRDLDDDIFDKINKAKEILKIKNDAHNDFWYAMAMAMSLNVSDNYQEEVEKLISCKQYDFLYDDKWDFKTTANVGILSQLVALFKTARIDIKDYNAYSANPISIKPLIEEEKKSLIKKYTPFYYSFIYRQFVANHSKNRREVNELLRKFIFWDSDIAGDSYKINQEKLLLDFLGKDKDTLLSQEQISLDVINAAIDELDDPSQTSDTNFDSEPQSGITGTPEPSDPSQKTDVNSIVQSIEIEELNVDELPDTTNGHAGGKTKNGRIGDAKRNQSEDIETGRLAELIVFGKLKKKYGVHKVKWLSQYGKEAGESPDGGDGYGYDITYKDENGDEYYAEVKGSKNDNFTFRMSKKEKDTAEKYGDKYVIFFVFNLSKERAASDIRIIRRAGLFNYKNGESFFANSKFNVDNREFLISLKKC